MIVFERIFLFPRSMRILRPRSAAVNPVFKFFFLDGRLFLFFSEIILFMISEREREIQTAPESSPAHPKSLPTPHPATIHGPTWPRGASSLPWKPGNLSTRTGCEVFLRRPVRGWRRLFPCAPEILSRAAARHSSWAIMAADRCLSSVETRKFISTDRL